MDLKIYITTNDGSYKEFNLGVINMFAQYALTLKPLDEISEEAGYVSALEEELDNNELLKEYKEEYENINKVMLAKKFLIDTVRLMMIEQSFRLEGINQNALEYYNRAVLEYQKYFKISKEIEENIFKNNI